MKPQTPWLRVFVEGVVIVAILVPLSTIHAQGQDGLADRIAIAAQLAQYSYRWDSKDTEGFAELFTEDAVVERRDVDGTAVSESRLVGREAIAEYARASHEGRLADRQTRHHMSGLVFLELSSDMALTENMALITLQTADDPAPVIRSSGIYRIRWQKTPDGWRMAQRVLFLDRFVPR